MVDRRKVVLETPIVTETVSEIELGTCHIAYRLGGKFVTVSVDGGTLPENMQDVLLALCLQHQEPPPVEEPVEPKP